MVITAYRSSSPAVKPFMTSHERQWKERIMKPEVFWIPGPWRGRLAIVARPRGGDWLQDEVSRWRQESIDVIVSLLEDEEAAQFNLLDEGRAAKDNGIRFISFPIPDRAAPSSTPDAVSLIAKMADALEQGKNVAVHCRQGVGRSGLIAAGVLMGSGVAAEQAFQAVSAARGLEVPETPEQLLWAQRLPSSLTLPSDHVR
jgi:protein-tyrosine phosphatase